MKDTDWPDWLDDPEAEVAQTHEDTFMMDLMKGLYGDQQQAILNLRMFLQSTTSQHVLTGSAGTGKTTTLEAFGKLAKYEGLKVYYTATTNKAAQVITKSINPIDGASTIHSLLGLKLKDDYNTGKQILVAANKFDTNANDEKIEFPSVIVVDEASMANIELINHIQGNYVDRGGKILYVGDEYQLAPIGEEYSPVFHMGYDTSYLTEIKRQALENPIIKLATQFRLAIDNGNAPIVLTDLLGTQGVKVVNKREFHQLIAQCFASQSYQRVEDGNFSKVVAWRNKTVIGYNKFIRREVLKFDSDLPRIGETYVANSAVVKKIMGTSGRDEDAVIIKNEEYVTITSSRGVDIDGISCYQVTLLGYDDMTFPIFADRDQYELARKSLRETALNLKEQYKFSPSSPVSAKEQQGCRKEIAKAWKVYFDLSKTIYDIRPAYAITTHRSQGSTFDITFIDMGDISANFDFKEKMRLMYVALTRAKTQAIVTF